MDRRARVALGLVLVAIAAAALLQGWGRSEHGGDGGRRDRGAGDVDSAESPLAKGAGAPALAGGAPSVRPPAPDTTGESGASGALVRGRVSVAGADGPLPAGSRVEVCALDSSAETLLQRSPIDATGRFEVPLGAEQVPTLRAFVVYAVLPGWARMREVVQVGPGREASIDLEAGTPGHDGVLRGRILDPTDAAVPGLRLLVTTDPRKREYAILPDPDAERYQLERGDVVEAVLTTDSEGRFILRGLANQPRTVVSLDDAWFVAESRRERRAADSRWLGEVTCRVVPAFVLDAFVTDAETGEILDPIDRWTVVRAEERTLDERRVGERSGRFRWHAPVPPGGEHGFDLAVRASASDYRAAERVLRFGPGQWTQHLDLPLARLQPDDVGHVRLVHALQSASGRPLELAVVRSVEFGESRGRDGVDLRYGRDGIAILELPAGPVRVAVSAKLPLGRRTLLAWRGSIRVEGGRTTDFEVPFPPTGTLRVRLPTAEYETITIVDPLDPGRQASVSTETPDLPFVPVGTWHVYLDRQGPDSAVRVEVTADRISEVVLQP